MNCFLIVWNGITVVSLSAMLHVMAYAYEKGTLSRNGMVGIRTKHTKKSDEAWDAGHRAAAVPQRRLAWATLALEVLVVAFFAITKTTSVTVTELVVYAPFVLIVAGMFWVASKANKAAKAV